MNTVLQCLAHTDDLTKYFLFNLYEHEMNKTDHKGIVNQFYFLLQELWLESSTNEINPNMIQKAIVEQYNHFNNQNEDAKEFLSTLLNLFHIELNRATMRKNNTFNKQIEQEIYHNSNGDNCYVGRKQSIRMNYINKEHQARPIRKSIMKNNLISPSRLSVNKCVKAKSVRHSQSQVVLNNFKNKEDSIIVDLFYGQLNSSIQCNECHSSMKTYEQFNILPLSIPVQKQTISFLFIPFKATNEPYESYFITLSEKTTLKTIKDQIICNHSHLITDSIEAVASTQKKIIQYKLEENDEVWPICVINNYTIIFYEKGPNEANSIYYYIYEANKKKISDPYRLSIADDAIEIFHFESKIKNTIILHDSEEMNLSVRIFHNIEGNCAFCKEQSEIYCDITDGNKSFKECVAQAQLKNKQSIVSFLVEIPLNSTYEIKNIKYKEMNIADITNSKSLIYLEDCFDYFSLYENMQNYLCPECQSNQINKIMKISIPPQHLIIQLKRFYYNTGFHLFKMSKVDTLVVFPLKDLNVKDYMMSKDQEACYDLYAIINHSSFISSAGRYIAYCKNGNNWFCYDDGKIREVINKKDLITKDAYLLFYKKH